MNSSVSRNQTVQLKLIKKSRILISLPISYIEQNCNAIDGLLKAFITSLNEIGFQLNGEVKLIYNRDIDKKLQHQVDDLFVSTAEPSIFLTFFKISEFIQSSSKAKAMIEILCGLIAIPLCLLLFYYGILRVDTPRVFGIAFSMIGCAPIILYFGIVNYRYQKWLG